MDNVDPGAVEFRAGHVDEGFPRPEAGDTLGSARRGPAERSMSPGRSSVASSRASPFSASAVASQVRGVFHRCVELGEVRHLDELIGRRYVARFQEMNFFVFAFLEFATAFKINSEGLLQRHLVRTRTSLTSDRQRQETCDRCGHGAGYTE